VVDRVPWYDGDWFYLTPTLPYQKYFTLGVFTSLSGSDWEIRYPARDSGSATAYPPPPEFIWSVVFCRSGVLPSVK